MVDAAMVLHKIIIYFKSNRQWAAIYKLQFHFLFIASGKGIVANINVTSVRYILMNINACSFPYVKKYRVKEIFPDSM
jgi:hypothetical protein